MEQFNEGATPGTPQENRPVMQPQSQQAPYDPQQSQQAPYWQQVPPADQAQIPTEYQTPPAQEQSFCGQPMYQQPNAPAPKKKNALKIVLPIVLVLLVAAAVAVYFLFFNGTPIDEIKFDDTSLTMQIGEEYTLTYEFTPDDATKLDVTWTSDDESIATVTDGKVVAVAGGKCTVTVTAESGAADSCEITVKSPEEMLLGTWSTELDMTKFLEEGLTEAVGMDASDLPKDIKVIATLTITFKEGQESNVAVAFDKDSVKSYLTALSDALVEMLYKLGEDSGVDRKTFDTFFASQYGMDIRSFVDTLLEELDIDALLQDASKSTDTYWKLEDGKLCLSEKEDFSGDDGSQIIYHFDGEKLVFDSFVGKDDALSEFEDYGITPPWTFTKK